MRILAAAFVAAFFMAAPASAQIVPRTVRVPCSGPEVLPELLLHNYGEAPTGQGVADGVLVQLWRNPGTGTWTLLMVAPDGTVCALASGEDWVQVDAPKPEAL